MTPTISVEFSRLYKAHGLWSAPHWSQNTVGKNRKWIESVIIYFTHFFSSIKKVYRQLYGFHSCIKDEPINQMGMEKGRIYVEHIDRYHEKLKSPLHKNVW